MSAHEAAPRGARLDPPEHWVDEPAGTLDMLAPALGRAHVIDPLFAAVMEASNSGFMILNASRRILYANRAMAELTGYSVDELLALPSAAVLTPAEDAARAREILQEAFRRRRRVVRHREVVHRDGHRIPVAASVEPLVIEGRAVALVVQFADRSDEARALAESRAHAEAVEEANAELALFREMVSRASDAMLIVQDGRIVMRNGAFRDRLGFDGRRTEIAEILEPESMPLAIAAIRRIESGESASELVSVWSRDARGERHTFEATLSPIAFHGAPAVLAVARDVTERVAMERRFRESERLDVLRRVSGGAAHELANALAALTAAAAEDAPRELRTAIDHSRRLASGLALIGGQGVGRPERLGVARLLSAVVAGLPADTAARVHVEAAPAIAVEGRRDDLALAVEALVTNALEAGPGRVEVEATVVLGVPDGALRAGEAREHVLIEIRDAGEGMTDEALAHVAEPFFSTKPGHVGLGVALAHAVVRAHAGRTTIESTPGAGTTVRIYLPLAAVAEPVEVAEPPDARAAGRRVLLADDNVTLRMVTAAALRRAGYDVTEAGSAEDARALLSASPAFDLLLLDIRLADGTGLDVFEEAGGPGVSPPALFVSGYSGSELADLPPSGGWAFISKPFSRQALLDAIDRLLDADPATA